MWHVVKVIAITVIVFCVIFYLLMCWVNLIDNDSETHKAAGEE